ncbi:MULTISPECIES: phosphoribosylamine--glycine ligase [unclassified Fusibacter]|uniref:phosphoribosylamine--glycine ligase n=1 Tax=unclassified Fusibacter TaxID=2624464 RepID=UPI001010CFAA|nr:phosphoribosylamine--glycine ligase [Fusibacter sp. A1]MCK8059607.1 phosphoribosylamine--glycine ligase [Fusibacter sp. A2]NPE21408.1 phosphoribosylamine--glycine ligase [Fusibacter sp. A1]RXV62100.1 phosphoribosylamine--glycine ligase [Fusibacter sp. A1]
MRVLLIGGGAREHALAWKLAQSEKLTKLYAAPGNPGIAEIAECVDIGATDIDRLVDFAVDENIEFVVVGPEDPLCMGIVDRLNDKGIKAFGPHKKAARLEGSKAYSKEFMLRHDIPTAKYGRFDDVAKAVAALPGFGLPVVIKADGLAAGKGVIIAQTANEAVEAIKDMLVGNSFGEAGSIVVIEEFLTGIEASELCFVDGNTIVSLESAQDYKRAYDGDLGLNTGGMGTYSPSRLYTDEIKKTINDKVLQPFIKGLQADGLEYQGLVFIGLILKDGQPKVFEFNTRFGDPETQSLMVRLENDLLDVMLKTVAQQLNQVNLTWSDEAAVTLVMAAGGYPEAYKKGDEITGLKEVKNAVVFHAGTKEVDGRIVTNGGRVLSVVAKGDTIEAARTLVYEEMKHIKFKDMMYRTDIAK